MTSQAGRAKVSRRARSALLNHRPTRSALLNHRRTRSALHNHRRWWSLAAGLAVLGVLVWQLGAGPFVDGLLATNPWAIAVALVVTAGTTWCCAVRWSLVSARVGEQVPVRTAYLAYYRSMLVNATLPGGVAGDVHRGFRHGWRGVVWERGVGYFVQVLLVGALVLPTPWRWAGLAVVAALLVAGGAVVALSAAAVAGHLVVFLVAAEAAGVALSPVQLLPVGALVLLGSAIPLSVAGWGPREGVAAWAFHTAGSTATAGLTVAVTFGVLAMVATLPGLLVLGSRRG